MTVLGCYPFRVTRNSDLFVDEEEVDDLRRALEGELAQRRYGAAPCGSRHRWTARRPVDSCCAQFALTRQDCTGCRRVNLHRLSAVYDLVHRPGPEVPGVRAGAAARLGRRGPVRDDPPARRAAAPPLPERSRR
jgi:polyphosphate kinase